MTRLFGTDGIRGKAYQAPLDENTVRRLGAALAEILTTPHVLLAGDTRSSTETLAAWFADGFQGGGGRVTWAGVLPTPAVSHLVRSNEMGAGVVISASHNPADDNGIKVLGPSGEKLADEDEARIEARIATTSPRPGGGLPPADRAFAESYLDLLVATHQVTDPLDGMHIVVDSANGAASEVAGELLCRLGARVTRISSTPNGNNINDGCGATAPGSLVERVAAEGADGGIALDGDADRSILVDQGGRVLDGDDILLAWSRDLAAAGRLPGGAVVATVMSNFGLERTLLSEGLKMIRSAVGDRWVWQAMLEHGSVLGGEQSGHVICSHYSVSGDGLLTGSHLLAIAARRGMPVSELSDLVRLPQILLNVPVGRKPPFEDIPRVRRELTGTERALSGRGRVLLRYSGTEDLARVMVEGDDAREIEALAEQIAEAIRSELR